MSSSATVIWLQAVDDGTLPNELHSHVALFTNEDACYQFLCSLSPTVGGLTLAISDPKVTANRLIELKQISAVYLLSSSVSNSNMKFSSKIHGLFDDRNALITQILLDLNRKKTSKPGFVAGVMAPFQGFYFLYTHSSTWSRAIVPIIVFTIILFACAVPAVWGMHIFTENKIKMQSSRWAHFGVWLLRLILYIVTLCLSLIIALLLAQPVSSPALESLVRAQERNLKYPSRPEEPFCASVWRSLTVAIVSIMISIVIFLSLTIIELLFPPSVLITSPLKFVATSFIVAYDIIDYPLSLHLLGVKERTPWFRHNLLATFGFGLAVEVICLIPGAFLFLLPSAVCGATRLVIEAERASIDEPLLPHEENA